MQFTSPLQTESELQWDKDSAPEWAVNCGPTSAEKIANYFKNLFEYGIEKTRRLGTSRIGTGTNTNEQKKMLDARGIPSSVLQLTPEQVHEKLKTGRRPLILWLVMSYIPNSVKGHTFDGKHAIAALANGVVDGETGIWVNEPDQHRGDALYKQLRFYADKYWIPGSKAIGRWCIVPDKDKVILTRFAYKKRLRAQAVMNIRTGPSRTSSLIPTNPSLPVGAEIVSNLRETAGGSYLYGGKPRRDWIGYTLKSGRQVWVAAAFLKEI